MRTMNGTNSLAVPMELVTLPQTITPASFSDLKQRGQFVEPLSAVDFMEQGSLSLKLDNRANVTPMAVNEKYEFNRKDQQFFVFIMWSAKDKRNTTTRVQIYDLDNNLLSDGKPTKLSMRPSQIAYTSWQMPVAAFRPGNYRIDVMLGNQPAWRTFFSVSE